LLCVNPTAGEAVFPQPSARGFDRNESFQSLKLALLPLDLSLPSLNGLLLSFDGIEQHGSQLSAFHALLGGGS